MYSVPQIQTQGMPQTQEMNVKEIENNSDIEKLITNHRLVVCKLHAKWCRPCKILTPKFIDFANFYKEKKDVAFCSIDIDAHEYYSSLISSIPAFLFYINGEVDKDRILVSADLVPVENVIIEELKKINQTTLLTT